MLFEGLERRFEGVDLKWFERKVRLFGLWYVIVDLWGRFIEVCKFIEVGKWYNNCERFFNFFKMYKM